jgi:hypothetical protein
LEQLSGAIVPPPPGLSRHLEVKVAQISADRLYEYRGTSPHEISCGIAMYGRVPKDLKLQLITIFEHIGSMWKLQPRSFYSFDGSVRGTETYWGLPNAPGVTGILLLERKPSPDAPTLEIDFHDVLIH